MQFEKIEIREDGFLEIQLSESLTFDDYLFSLIQEDRSCLYCIRDHRKTNHYYYDLHGFQSLRDYLNHGNEIKDYLAFLINLFTIMQKVTQKKRMIFDCDYIFLSPHGQHIRVLCVPVLAEQESEAFPQFIRRLCELLGEMKDYEVLGRLFAASLQETSIAVLLSDLHAIAFKREKALPFWKRWLKKKQKPIISEAEPLSARELPMELAEDATQVLFGFSQSALVSLDGTQRFELIGDVVKIGRAMDNDLVLSQASISSHHACYHVSEHRLMDLGSLNGTYVNDVKVQECVLKQGDRIRFAMETYLYTESEAVHA